MQTLFPLVKSLTPVEVKGIRAVLKCHSTNNKLLQLFEFLRKQRRTPEDIFIRNTLLGKSNSVKSYNALIKKLENEILDYFISIKNLESLSPTYRAKINIIKKLVYCNYLIAVQSSQPIYSQILDEIIRLGKENEDYLALADATSLKQIRLGIRAGKEEHARLGKEFRHYVKCYQAIRRALELYVELSIIRGYQAVPDPQQHLVFLVNSIRELKELYTQTHASQVDYYLKYFEMEYYEVIGDYNKAIEVGFLKLDLIKKNQVLYRTDRIGITYDDISQYEIRLGRYENAIRYAKDAQEFFARDGYDFWIAKRSELEALFYNEQYNKARKIVNEFLAANIFDEIRFKKSVFKLYEAFVLLS